jgi:hypothetical protein
VADEGGLAQLRWHCIGLAQERLARAYGGVDEVCAIGHDKGFPKGMISGLRAL